MSDLSRISLMIDLHSDCDEVDPRGTQQQLWATFRLILQSLLGLSIPSDLARQPAKRFD